MNKLVKFKATGFSGKVDSDNNILRGLTLIEANREALGHGMYVDETMIDQVVSKGAEFGDTGAKARYDHPNACFSSMGTQLGRFKNFRREGTKAVADLHIGAYTKDSPNGDIGAHIMALAKEDPDMVGLSIVFSASESETFEAGEGDNPDDLQFQLPHARIDSFHGADVVDEGAATDGLYGRPNYLAEQAEHWLSDKSDLVKSLLEPMVKELFTELNENINQNQSKMSDNKKSLKDGLKDLLASFSSEEVVEVPATPEVNEDVNPLEVELSSKNDEIEAFKAEIESIKTDFATKSEETDELLLSATESIKALNSEIEGYKSEIEALKSESIGSVVEEVASTDTSVDLSDEAKAERKELSKAEQIALWASQELAGETASKTYINN